MCSQLREIYDKKSPIFIAQICIFIATIILLNDHTATCFPVLNVLYLVMAVLSGTQIICKTLVLSLIYSINKEVGITSHTGMVGIFVIAHIAVWIYTIILYNNPEFQNCKHEQPHFFFVKVYGLIYAVLLAGAGILLILLLIPVAYLTLFSTNKREQESL